MIVIRLSTIPIVPVQLRRQFKKNPEKLSKNKNGEKVKTDTDQFLVRYNSSIHATVHDNPHCCLFVLDEEERKNGGQ